MPKVLTSWKEVAQYLGKGVRTVQRWERQLGLPVRRPAKARGCIIAVPEEIDAWVQLWQCSKNVSGPGPLGGALAAIRQENERLAQQLIAAQLENAAVRSRQDYARRAVRACQRALEAQRTTGELIELSFKILRQVDLRRSGVIVYGMAIPGQSRSAANRPVESRAVK